MNYLAPQSFEEASEYLHEFGTDAKILAGGTDLMIQLERGLIAPGVVISLDQIPGWDALHIGDSITIGAGTSYRQLEKAPLLLEQYTALIEASRQVGGIQVRNVATVAGNLCNASPAADSVPPLLVFDAALTLAGVDGERTVPVDEFILGPGQTTLASTEILKQIHMPAPPAHTASIFLKAGRRRAMEISFVSVAVCLTMDGERVKTARIALGAVAPTPIRVPQAEHLLEGHILTADRLREAGQLAVEAADPISDVRASADYRRHLVDVMVQRACEACQQRITGEGA